MDLQAILDAGDSSTSSSSDGGGVYARRPAAAATANAVRGRPSAGGAGPSSAAAAAGGGAAAAREMDPDLERLLRVDFESDDNDDSNDFGADEQDDVGGRYQSQRGTRGTSSSSATASAAGRPSVGTNSVRGGGASVAASVSADTSMTHTAEDWAVLQSILDDDDDDDDDETDSSSSLNRNSSIDNDVQIGLSKDWASRVSRHTGSIGVGYGSSTRKNNSSGRSPTRRNVDDDDEDDEDDLADLLGSSSAANRPYRTPSSSHKRTTSRSSAGSGSSSLAASTNPDVDAILRSMASEDEDDDDDNDDVDMGTITAGLNNASTRDGYVFNFGDDAGAKSSNKKKGASVGASASSTPVKSLGYDMAKTASFDRKRYRDRAAAQRSAEEKKDTSSPTSEVSALAGSSGIMSPTNASQAISAAYLRHARNAEQKLLRPGQKDIVSPLMVKRRMKPREMLTSRIKKDGAGASSASGRDSESAAAKATAAAAAVAAAARLPGTASSASVVESKPLTRIGKELLMNSRERKFSVGLPTALAVSSKFIAVGTQKGQVLVFDHFEVLKLRLGGSASSSGGGGPELSPSAGSVTSIDLSHDGDALIAGYTSGLVVLWDAIRGTILKSVGDAHASPVTSVRFLPQPDSIGVVTVDAGGLVNRLIFSKAVLWGSYNVETECLLDGTAGQILATHVLSPLPSVTTPAGRSNEEISAPHPSFKKLVLVALSSDRSTFSVAVEPKVSVLYRWARPSDEMMDIDSFFSTLTTANATTDTTAPDGSGQKSRPAPAPTAFLPCISWGWSQVQGGGKALTPILARGWGCAIQFLRASFPEIDDSGLGDDSEMPPWPAFGEYIEFQSSAPVVALEWLDSRSLVYLTVTNEFTIVDTVMMTLTERLDFSVVKLVYAEFALSRTASTAISNSDGGTKPITVRSQSITTTFQNSIRSADGRILILCQEGLLSVSNLGIEKRVSTLEEDGEWLEALALALDHYESTIKSLEDRRRLRDGDLSRHPEFAKGQRSEEEEWIASLLMRYMHLAVENAPEPIQDDSLSLSGRGRQQSRFIDLAHGHFQMLAGVCIDFCVVTRRLDLLFGPVFECFKVAQYVSVFFDVLEPYVLNDRLDYIAPEAMTHFIEHCKAMNDLAIVERCLLHMNVAFMDFDTILSLLRSNGMYTALLHVYSRGLDDFATPLAELFEAIFNAADDCNARTYKRPDGVPKNLYEKYGYKAIMYVEYCLRGKMFPQGGRIEPTDKAQAIRREIVHFLQEKTYAPPPTVRSTAMTRRTGLRRLPYPYLQLLVALDPKALLDTLSVFFDEPDFTRNENRADAFGIEMSLSEGGLSPECQEIASILSDIVMPENETTSGVGASAVGETIQSQATRDIFLDFVAKYLLRGSITVSVPITMKILTRMSSLVMEFDSSSPNIAAAQQDAQKKVLELLGALPRNSYDHQKALKIVEEAGFNRAALLLHRESLMSLLQSGATREVVTHHFCSSIDCYLRDSDRDYKALVFDYIKNDCMSSIVDCAASEQELKGSAPASAKDLLKAPIFGKLPELINLDPVQSTQLVTEVFIEDVDEVIASLDGEDNEIALFNFFHAIVSGSLAKIDPVAGPALLANLTLSHHQKYLLLMARYHPEMMYQHLTTHDNYRVEDCLKLCQEYDIADASAYLLERMGNVSSALQLMLQTLEARLMGLKRIIRSIGSESGSNHHRRKGSHLSTSSTGSSRRGANANAKGSQATCITANDTYKKELERVRQSLVVALDLCERNSGASKPRSDHGSQLWFNILDRLTNAKGFLRLHKEQSEHSTIMLALLAELLELSMQRMVSVVPLPDLLRKITTDHSGSSLGEFKEMLATLLKTYNTELKLSKNALGVMNNDIQQMTAEKRRLKLRGYRIESFDDPLVKVLDISGEASSGQRVNETTNLSRLRAKRNQRLARQGEKRGRSSLSTNPRNRMGEFQSSANFGPRQIGRLSQADNYGRLM